MKSSGDDGPAPGDAPLWSSGNVSFNKGPSRPVGRKDGEATDMLEWRVSARTRMSRVARFRHITEVAVLPPSVMSADAQNPSELPSGLLEALQGRTKKSKPPFRPLSGFENGLKDLTAEGDQPSNKYQLLCPRDECRSVILREGVATLCEGFNIQVYLPLLIDRSLITSSWNLEAYQSIPSYLPFQKPPLGGSFNPPPWSLRTLASLELWTRCRCLPMVQSTRIAKVYRCTHICIGQKLKLLICADCDLGPLGWCEEGGKKFYLACSRVSYRYES